ncbi:MAG: acyl-CoA-binding protein [Actinobacteria bacterium]|nr:acyl-CoA-binding protein [Actinomycetota bacterium]MCB9412459.1 acyl-CoA-binding protein [Actinomycetota bacterium]
MAELDEQFEAAVAASTSLPNKPDQATLLKIYALFKQAKEGDVSGKRPGFTNPVGRAKYDARSSLKGMSSEDAKQQYVDLIDSLK